MIWHDVAKPMHFKQRSTLWHARNEFLSYFRDSCVVWEGEDEGQRNMITNLLKMHCFLRRPSYIKWNRWQQGITWIKAEHFAKIKQTVIPNIIVWKELLLKLREIYFWVNTVCSQLRHYPSLQVFLFGSVAYNKCTMRDNHFRGFLTV